MTHRSQQLALLARRHRILLVSVAAGVLLSLFLCGLVVSMRTAEGTLIVEIDDPNASLQVFNEEGKVLVEGKEENGQILLSVEPGKYRLRIEKDSFAEFARDFTVTSGRQETIRVRSKPSGIAAKPIDVAVPSPDQTPPTPLAPPPNEDGKNG
jgi:hypothetical protein